ncbi:olfactory receptor 2A7-like [Anomaloglossus baeobatrachus]
MSYGNQTELILIGFFTNLMSRIFLSILFSVIYLLTILGNGFLILTVIVSPQLHTPMYYFLCNLSLIDLGFISCTLPKLLYDIISNTRKISVTGCLIQMSFGFFLGANECLLLAVMAYDRYIAICLPLHYTTIMSWRVCRCITIIILVGSLIVSLMPDIIKPLVFCGENKVNHFACEILALLELACGELTTIKNLMFFQSFFILILPLMFIVITYICIIVSLSGIRSAQGKSKTFSTCASHLTVVIMFYGASMTSYMGQARLSSSLKYITISYGLLTPVLNPLIYSLRNNDVKAAFRKILTRYSVM